jgi:hypothetical protein
VLGPLTQDSCAGIRRFRSPRRIYRFPRRQPTRIRPTRPRSNFPGAGHGGRGFNDILQHVQRWNRFGRLVLVDGLTLSGNSPRLVGQYSLRAVIFTQGEAATETVPRLAVVAAAASAAVAASAAAASVVAVVTRRRWRWVPGWRTSPLTGRSVSRAGFIRVGRRQRLRKGLGTKHGKSESEYQYANLPGSRVQIAAALAAVLAVAAVVFPGGRRQSGGNGAGRGRDYFGDPERIAGCHPGFPGCTGGGAGQSFPGSPGFAGAGGGAPSRAPGEHSGRCPTLHRRPRLLGGSGGGRRPLRLIRR